MNGRSRVLNRKRKKAFQKNPHCTLCGQLMMLERGLDNTACFWHAKKFTKRQLVCNKCRIDKNKEWKSKDIWRYVKSIVNCIKYILFRSGNDGKR